MKKVLCLGVAAACLIATVAMAQQRAGNNGGRKDGKCSYSPLQEVIRDARGTEMIQKLAQSGVDFNAVPRCGGSALQLAILRGNPEIVKALLESGADVSKSVSLADFPIVGAPKEVPVLLFAGYYAPRQDIMRLLLSAGASVTGMDSNGETVLWYINQNPVLRNTELSDEIKGTLLVTKSEMPMMAGGEKTTLQKTPSVPQKPVMQRVNDPRVPVQSAIITKTGKDTIGYSKPAANAPMGIAKSNTKNTEADSLPAGTIVVHQEFAYPTREIVEPDMPVK